MGEYTGYYYDPGKDMAPGIDSNELYIGDNLISMITEVRSSDDLCELQPRPGEKLVLLIPTVCESNYHIINHNPCPEF